MYQGYYNFPYGYGSIPMYQMGNTASNIMTGATGGGLFSKLAGLKRSFNFSSFLTNTQKTLGVINQAIPIVYQVKPIWNNAKTMIKVMGALKENDLGSTSPASELRTEAFMPNGKASPSATPIEPISMDNQPQFFL